MSQYDYQNNKQQDYGQDLFQEYLNDEAGREEKSKIQVSDQVEEDILEYALNEDGKKTVEHHRRRTALMAVGIGVFAVAIVGVSANLLYSRSHTDGYNEYYEEPYIIDETETEYSDPWDILGDDLGEPEFILEGEYYRLPVEMSQFMENGWTIKTSGFSNNVNEVGADPVSLFLSQDYGDTIEVTVVSPDGSTVPLSDAMVTGVYVDTYASFDLPGYVMIGDSSWYLEDTLRESDVTWSKQGRGTASTYTVSSNQYSYSMVFSLEDDNIENIKVELNNAGE